MLLNLYCSADIEPAGKAYIKWIADNCLGGLSHCRPIFVINNAFRNRGYQFLYDCDTLKQSLQAVGFSNIVRCLPQRSEHRELQNVESYGSNIGGEEINRFETMVLEATRPLSGFAQNG